MIEDQSDQLVSNTVLSLIYWASYFYYIRQPLILGIHILTSNNSFTPFKGVFTLLPEAYSQGCVMSSQSDPISELKQEDYLKLFVSWFRLYIFKSVLLFKVMVWNGRFNVKLYGFIRQCECRRFLDLQTEDDLLLIYTQLLIY